MRKLHIILTLCFLSVISNQAIGQTPTSTPDPALTALQAQQAILDAKLKILQDQQAMTTALLPASSTTPNSGAVTVNGSNPFTSQRLAYEQLNEVAKTISKSVKGKGLVAVYDPAEINSLVNYKAIYRQLELFHDQIDELVHGACNLKRQAAELNHLKPVIDKTDSKPPDKCTEKAQVEMIAPVLIPGLAEGSIKTAIDIIGLFRTNTTITNSSFTLDDAALTAAVVNELSNNHPVYQPSVVSVSPTDEDSDFLDEMTTVAELLSFVQNQSATNQSEIQQISDALNAYLQADQAARANEPLVDPKKPADVAKQAALERAREIARQYACAFFSCELEKFDVPAAIQKKAACDHFLRIMASFVSGASATVTAFNALQTALMKVTDSGNAVLAVILRAEKLTNLLKPQPAPSTTDAKASDTKTDAPTILLVKSSVLGGSVVTRTNLWTGGHLYFTGGAIANFTLFNIDGSVVKSGVVIADSCDPKDQEKAKCGLHVKF